MATGTAASFLAHLTRDHGDLLHQEGTALLVGSLTVQVGCLCARRDSPTNFFTLRVGASCTLESDLTRYSFTGSITELCREATLGSPFLRGTGLMKNTLALLILLKVCELIPLPTSTVQRVWMDKSHVIHLVTANRDFLIRSTLPDQNQIWFHVLQTCSHTVRPGPSFTDLSE